jgi:FkbM family methyltransferase
MNFTDGGSDVFSQSDGQYLMAMQQLDHQVFENIIARIYSTLVKPGDTCLDGGANNGLHTLPLARSVGPEGAVFAVEPVPDLAQSLLATIEARNLRQVRICQQALYHERRTIDFNVVTNAPSRSGIAPSGYRGGSIVTTITVETLLIDDLLAAESSWRFGKLDLEGGEFRALQGGRAAIERHKPFLVFERSVGAPGWYGYSVDDFFDFFDDLKYEVFDLFGAPLTVEDWSLPDRPWYAVAVSANSADSDFVRRRLPTSLRAIVDAERIPAGVPSIGGGQAGIWAVPNPVPAGDGAGITTVYWDTGDDSIGEVYISVNCDDERLFYRSANGSRPAPWINAWGSYEFRLYRGTSREELVSTVTVTRRKVERKAARYDEAS